MAFSLFLSPAHTVCQHWCSSTCGRVSSVDPTTGPDAHSDCVFVGSIASLHLYTFDHSTAAMQLWQCCSVQEGTAFMQPPMRQPPCAESSPSIRPAACTSGGVCSFEQSSSMAAQQHYNSNACDAVHAGHSFWVDVWDAACMPITCICTLSAPGESAFAAPSMRAQLLRYLGPACLLGSLCIHDMRSA